MSNDSDMIDRPQGTEHGTFKAYVLGFILSILLTVAAYLVVAEQLLAGWTLVFAIIGLAIAQMFVQLLLFLHLGKESKPRWNLLIFLFMALVVVILVFGSLWIMYNLNYRVMAT
jgi:cytochrome o ubiquinol oxidase operon protein cyoD